MKNGIVLWLTGLPCSGKTTLSLGIEEYFRQKDLPFQRLDGDVVRTTISKDLGFSKADREANIERLSYVAQMLANNGINVSMAFVSPYRHMRERARALIGENFVEVYVRASVKKCMERDVKGMYAKAKRGEIKDFTGVQDPFEEPTKPEIVVDTEKESIDESVQKIIAYIEKKYNDAKKHSH